MLRRKLERRACWRVYVCDRGRHLTALWICRAREYGGTCVFSHGVCEAGMRSDKRPSWDRKKRWRRKAGAKESGAFFLKLKQANRAISSKVSIFKGDILERFGHFRSKGSTFSRCKKWNTSVWQGASSLDNALKLTSSSVHSIEIVVEYLRRECKYYLKGMLCEIQPWKAVRIYSFF